MLEVKAFKGGKKISDTMLMRDVKPVETLTVELALDTMKDKLISEGLSFDNIQVRFTDLGVDIGALEKAFMDPDNEDLDYMEWSFLNPS